MTRLKAKVLTVTIVVLVIAGLCTGIAFAAGVTPDSNALTAQSEAVSGNYAVLEENDDTLEGGGQAYTLTFKYAEEEVTPDAVAVYTGYENGFANKDNQLWKEYRDSVTKVSFDESVQNHLEPASMSHWFYGFSSLVSVDGLERISVVNANSNGPASMAGMFQDCSAIKSLVIPFDTSNYRNLPGDMKYMFSGCSSLETLDISALDTRAAAANVVTRSDGNGNFVPYYNGLTGMLEGASSLSTLFLGSNTQLTSDCGLLVPVDVFPYTGKWVTDGKDAVTTDGLIELSATSGAAIGAWTLETTSDTSKLAYAILYSDGELVIQPTNEVDSQRTVEKGPQFFDTSAAVNGYWSLPWGDESWRPKITSVSFKDNVSPVSMSYWFNNAYNVKSINFAGLNTSKLASMDHFAVGTTITSLDLSTLDLTSVSSMESAFATNALESIALGQNSKLSANALPEADGAYPHTGKWVCEGKSSLTSAELVAASADGQAVGTWTLETTTDGPDAYAFAILYENGDLIFQRGNTPDSEREAIGTFAVDEIGSYQSEQQVPWYTQRWSVRSVSFKDEISPVSIAYWFSGLENLESFNYENLNTSNTVNMSKSFAGIRTSSLDLSSLNTSSATDMSGMFSSATIDNLNLSSFDTSNATNMREMFFYARISELNLSNFDTRKVTNMATMFDGCSVKTLDISSFDTALARSSVDSVSGGSGVAMMLSYTDNLASLKLGQKSILTGANLPDAAYADGSYAKWTGPGGQSLTSEELMAQYDGSVGMVGTWTRIAPIPFQKATIDIPANPRYESGQSIDLNETVTLDGVALMRGTDYTIEFVKETGSTETVTPNGPGYYCVHFTGTGKCVGDQWKWVLLVDGNEIPGADPVYKLFEPSTARWAYTINEAEANSLVENGWESAGIAFYEYSGAAEHRAPMYCVYNPTTHEYFYTQSIYERDYMVQDSGWEDRGVSWYTDERDSVAVYRMYYYRESDNQGLRYYTTSNDEVDGLKACGWLYEGIGWHAVSPGTSTRSPLDANDISSAQVSGIADLTYTGEALTQNITVTVGGSELVADTDYTVKYANNTNAGTATVTITGIGSYTGEIAKIFTISPAEITSVTLAVDSLTYDGAAKEPAVTVKAGELDVPADAYDVAYADNTNAGTATATVTAKENGNFTGGKAAEFAIGKAEITAVTVAEGPFTYDGTAKEPAVTVKAGELDVPAGAYDAAYSDNTNAGTATVTVTAKENGNFTGSKAAEFAISPLDISDASVSVAFDLDQTTGLTYEGGKYSIEYQGAETQIQPVPVLSFSGSNLAANTDYAVSYSDNIEPGMATVTISGAGNYTGTRTIAFEILTPKKTQDVGDGTGDVKSVTAEGTSLVDEKPEGANTDVELVVEEKTDTDAQALKAEFTSGKDDVTFSSVIDVKLEAVTKDDIGTVVKREEIKDDVALTLTFDVSKGGTQINGKIALVVHMHEGTEAGREVQPVVNGTVIITVSELSDFVIVVQDSSFDADIAHAAIEWPDLSSYVYDGAAKEPKPVSVTANGETLAEGAKYEVAYEENTNAGTATATVTGKGTYTGSLSRTFSIAKRPVTVSAKSAEKAYDGAALTAAATGYEADGLVKASDIASVALSGSITDAGSTASKVGTVVFADGMEGNYEVTRADGVLKVTPAPITGVRLSATSFTYTGSQQRPSVTARWSGGDVPASGYDVSWPADTTSVGTKTVAVTGKGNFAGTASAEYAITAAPEPDPEPTPDPDPAPVASQAMHRLYNPNSGEHFYTADDAERDGLVALGWNSEGEGWTAPVSSATPVYRMYNPVAGEHHYTPDASERDMLIGVGWNDEGIGWYSDDAKTVPLYRDYNPNAFANNHNYTVDEGEHEWLLSLGWRDEGYAWYGM